MQHNSASIDTTYFSQSMINFAQMSVLVRFAAPFLVRYSAPDLDGNVRPLTDVPTPLPRKDPSYDCDVIGMTMTMIDHATDRPYLRWLDLLAVNYFYEEKEMTFWASKETWPIGTPRDDTYRGFVYDIICAFRGMTKDGLYKRRTEEEMPECFFLEPEVLTTAQYYNLSGPSMLAQSHKWAGEDREFQEPACMTVANMRPANSIYFYNQILFARLDGCYLYILVVTQAGKEKRVAMFKFDLFSFILDYVHQGTMKRHQKRKPYKKFDAPALICLSDSGDSDSSDDDPEAKREKKEKE